MHGRKKLQINELQRNEIREKQLSKIRTINSLLESVENEKSSISTNLDSLLDKTASILKFDCNKVNIWNLRKEIFIYIKFNKRNNLVSYFNSELEFVKTHCLPNDSKSYSAWYQIKYLVKMIGIVKLDFNYLLKLTEEFISKDERNFHCWNFRRYILSTIKKFKNDSSRTRSTGNKFSLNHSVESKEPPATATDTPMNEPSETMESKLADFDITLNELNYTESLIRLNFSNYSAWHHRSLYINSLLQNKSSGGNSLNCLNAEAFINELDLIHNALFTSPSDQSIWSYYKLILDIVLNDNVDNIPLFLSSVRLMSNKYKLNVTLSNSVKQFPPTFRLVDRASSTEQYILADWTPMCEGKSTNWSATINLNQLINDDRLLYLKYSDDEEISISFDSKINFSNNLRDSLKFNFLNRISRCKNCHDEKILCAIMNSYNLVKELNAVEQKNKFLLLALIRFESQFDFYTNFNSIISYLDVLIAEDTDRSGYYRYQKCLYIFLISFFRMAHKGSQNIHIDVSHLSLFTVPDLDLLYHATQLDLTGNKEISNLKNIKYCHNIQQLLANHCSVQSLEPLKNLKSLFKIELNSNNIEKLEQIVPVFIHLHFQLEISLLHNPISDENNLQDTLKSLSTRPILLNGKIL